MKCIVLYRRNPVRFVQEGRWDNPWAICPVDEATVFDNEAEAIEAVKRNQIMSDINIVPAPDFLSSRSNPSVSSVSSCKE